MKTQETLLQEFKDGYVAFIRSFKKEQKEVYVTIRNREWTFAGLANGIEKGDKDALKVLYDLLTDVARATRTGYELPDSPPTDTSTTVGQEPDTGAGDAGAGNRAAGPATRRNSWPTKL